jgi:hypothetical protein
MTRRVNLKALPFAAIKAEQTMFSWMVTLSGSSFTKHGGKFPASRQKLIGMTHCTRDSQNL